MLDVLFVHTYCTQENLDSQPVFHDVNATIQTLNSTWRDADGSDWLLHFSEGDKQVVWLMQRHLPTAFLPELKL